MGRPTSVGWKIKDFVQKNIYFSFRKKYFEQFKKKKKYTEISSEVF